MAQCKSSPQDFIQDAFSPMVAVLCSHDAELVCQRNNLSFVELVQPFCRVNTEAHIRDSGNVSHTVHNLHISIRDMNMSPPQPTLVKKMLNEAVANALPQNYESPRNSVITVGAYDLQLSTTTPWFEAYRDCFLQVSHPSDHEFLKHFLACIFVVSSSHADPMDQFAKLTQQQHSQQHQQPAKYPRWFCPNILRYYVLIHDVMEEETSKGEAVYQSMKSTYGINNCHFLQINSRSPNAPDNLSTEGGSIPDPWSQFMPKKLDTSDNTSYDSLSIPDSGVFPAHVQEGQPTLSTLSQSQSMVSLDGVDSAFEVTEESEPEPAPPPSNPQNHIIDHPLAPDVTVNHNNSTSDPTDNLIPRDSQNNQLSDQTLLSPGGEKVRTHGACLTLSDHDRLRIFVHEFIIRGLIPWAERTLRTLNEQVTSRKGIHRSLFNIPKKWFVGNKPAGQIPSAEKTSVVFTPEAPEMQMRRLADLAFMFQLHEMAYQTYHAAKKEFNSEHAWLHFAGALEMACIAVFMQGNNSQRQYPAHYLETAITTYLNSCKSIQFATRATLLSTEALKSKNLYTEAALQFIKMTSEDSDLRSALLLEQAAHCFIKMKQPMVRKYAFHMILAGHRFSKACQRRHALRSYSQALQVYKGKDWGLAEDHINFTLGRQSFNLKHLENATAAFKHLLTADSKQSPPQQSAFLREYLFVFKQQLNQYSPDVSTGGMVPGELPQLPLPAVDGNDIKVLCVEGPQNREDGKISASSVDFTSEESDNAVWQKLEDFVLVSIHGSIPAVYKSTVCCYSSRTYNVNNPICVLGEPVTVEVKLNNPMKVPLVLIDLTLLWKFLPVKYDQENQEKPPQLVSNEQSLCSVKNNLSEELVEGQVLPEVILQAGEAKQVRLYLIPQATGELHITGLAYDLGTNSPAHASEPANISKPSFIAAITIRGKVTLDVQGPRLNNTKEEKASKMYGPDRRLDLVIVPRMPKLQVSFSDFPDSLLCGEVQQITVNFENSGHYPLHRLHIACNVPEFFTIASSNNGNCAIPDKTGIYQTLINTSECDSEEYPLDSPKINFIVKIDLPSGQLPPGETLSLPMWVRGPVSTGSYSVHFLFYYQSTESNPKLKHRVLHHKAQITVNESLSLRACASRAHDGQVCTDSKQTDTTLQDVVISLEIENMNNVQDSSITEFSILQVSCVSCQWHLRHMSTQRHSDMRVSSGESTLMCLRASRCKQSLVSSCSKKVFTNVTFDQHQIHSAAIPCADFYFRSQPRPSFSEVEAESTKAQKIAADIPVRKEPFVVLDKALQLDLTLIVLWKAFVVEETGPCSVIQGQHHITLQELSSSVYAPLLSKVSVEQLPMKVIKEPEDPGPPVPRPVVTSQLLKYQLHHPKQLTHDFCKKRLCRAKVQLSLHNCSQTTLEVLINTIIHTDAEKESKESDKSETSSEASKTFSPFHRTSPAFTWGGRGGSALKLTSDSTHNIQLYACFTHSGVYDLGQLGVVARPLEKISGMNVEWTKQTAHSTNLIVLTNKSNDLTPSNHGNKPQSGIS